MQSQLTRPKIKMEELKTKETKYGNQKNKTLKLVLAFFTAAIFLFIYSSINTGLSTAAVVMELSVTAIAFVYALLALTGLFLGFLAQLIIYKAINLESKSFFYVLLAVVVIAAPVRTFLMLFRDIPTLIQTLTAAVPLTGFDVAALSKALFFTPFICTISFLLPFFLRQRKITKEKLKPLIAILIGIIAEYLILTALKAIT